MRRPGRPVWAHRSTLVALTALLLLSPLVAPAAHAAAPAVRDRYLPTWAEVDARYPGFENGYRETYAGRETFVIKQNCVDYTLGPRAAKGRFSEYFDQFGNIPVHDGYAMPSIQVLSYATASAAQKAWVTQRNWITNCTGKSASGSGRVMTFTSATPGALGDKRVGYRLERVDGRTDHTNQLVYWVRDGKFLLNMIVRQDVEGAAPASAPLIELTRLTLARLP